LQRKVRGKDPDEIGSSVSSLINFPGFPLMPANAVTASPRPRVRATDATARSAAAGSAYRVIRANPPRTTCRAVPGEQPAPAGIAGRTGLRPERGDPPKTTAAPLR